jgi:hypothetical protein
MSGRKTNPVRFHPVSASKAIQQISNVWKSSPDLHGIRSPPPFISPKTGLSYVSGVHVLLQEPRTYPEDATEPIGLCYVAYNYPGVTTHSFLHPRKRPHAIANLGLGDDPHSKRPCLGEEQPAANTSTSPSPQNQTGDADTTLVENISSPQITTSTSTDLGTEHQQPAANTSTAEIFPSPQIVTGETYTASGSSQGFSLNFFLVQHKPYRQTLQLCPDTIC